jgi:3D (Asp-Asp-Asp) domain-containing protein
MKLYKFNRHTLRYKRTYLPHGIIIFLSLLLISALTHKRKDSSTHTVETRTVVLKPLIHTLTATYYNAEEAQCDSDPDITADGSKVVRGVRWVALSRDLLRRWGGKFDYGDTIYAAHADKRIEGIWVVHDCMNARFKNRIDFLIEKGQSFNGVTKGVAICVMSSSERK